MSERSFVERNARVVRALIFSPVIILLASATRLLLISNYNTTTATTVASEVGVTGTLLGTVAPLLPPYLPVLFLGLVVLRRWLTALFFGLATLLLSPAYVSNPRRSWDDAYTQAIGAYSLGGNGEWAALWATYPYVVASAATALLLVFLLTPPAVVLGDAETAVGLLLRLLARVFYAALVAVVAASITLLVQVTYQVPFNADIVSEIGRRPWLPAEAIVTSDGVTTIGYTLSAGENWHTVLRNSDRSIAYIKVDDISARTVCSPPSTYVEQPRLPLLSATGVVPQSTAPCPPGR